MTEVSDTLALKWSYRHHSLLLEEFPSLDEAIDAAHWAAEYGEESLVCIEVYEATGPRVIAAGDAREMGIARNPDEEREPVPWVAIVEVTEPESAQARGRRMEAPKWFTSRDEADAFAARIAERIGQDRVRVVEPRMMNGVACRR